MTKKLNEPEKGNWEKVAREVKAANNHLFAEAFALGYLQSRDDDDSMVVTLLRLKIAEILPIIRDFVLFKLGDEAEYVLQSITLINFSEVSVSKGLLSEYQLERIISGNGTLDDFEDFYTAQIKLAPGGFWGGEPYLELVKLLKKFLEHPDFDNLHALVHWAHHSGHLFEGATAKNAPLTEDFAERLSGNVIQLRDLYTEVYDPDVKVVLNDYLEDSKHPGGRAAKKRLDSEKLWRRPGK